MPSRVRESAFRYEEQPDGCAASGDSVTVMGERFAVELEQGETGDLVHLVHPRWSVMGSGRTVEEAELDLRAEARELGRIVSERNPEDFTRVGREMRDFAMKFLTASA